MTNHLARSKTAAIVTALVAAVHLAAVTWVPIVHSELEGRTASAGIESEHSPDCSEAHHETSCTTCAAPLCAATTQQRHTYDAPPARLCPRNPVEDHSVGGTFLNVRTVRAPPTL